MSENQVCPYKDKPCELWDGYECIALSPEDCPHETVGGRVSIIDWQARQMKPE